jgi:single-stranded DNA-binding protein
MSNLNDVTLMGRLTRDPELKYTTTGKAVMCLCAGDQPSAEQRSP